MTMTYDGALVMPSSYAVMNEEEMTYVEGGGTTKISVQFTVTANLLKAVAAGGIGVAVGAISTAVCGALGVTGIGSYAIPGVVSFASGLITSYVNDTKYKDLKNKTFKGSVSCWTPFNMSANIKFSIGW